MNPNTELTCSRMRAMTTGRGLLAGSTILLRVPDGTPLRVIDDEVIAPTTTDEVGRERLTAPPVLALVVERVYP